MITSEKKTIQVNKEAYVISFYDDSAKQLELLMKKNKLQDPQSVIDLALRALEAGKKK